MGDSAQVTSSISLAPSQSDEGDEMARCIKCCNLLKSWKPTVKSDWLFEEKWKCKATGEAFEKYYLITQERECPFYEKRPRLLTLLEDLEA